MNMMDSETHFDDAKPYLDYITEFKEKMRQKLPLIPHGVVLKANVSAIYSSTVKFLMH